MPRPVRRSKSGNIKKTDRGTKQLHVLLRVQSLEAQANVLRIMSLSPAVNENIKPILVFFAESIDADCEYIRDCHWKDL